MRLTVLRLRDGEAAVLGFGKHRSLKSSRGGQTCRITDMHAHSSVFTAFTSSTFLINGWKQAVTSQKPTRVVSSHTCYTAQE